MIHVAHHGVRRTGVIYARQGIGVVKLRAALAAIGGGQPLARLERGAGHGASMWDSEVRAGRKHGHPAIFVRGCYGFRRAIYNAIADYDYRLIASVDLGRLS